MDLAFRLCHGILGTLDPVKPFCRRILWILDPVFGRGTCLLPTLSGFPQPHSSTRRRAHLQLRVRVGKAEGEVGGAADVLQGEVLEAHDEVIILHLAAE